MSYLIFYYWHFIPNENGLLWESISLLNFNNYYWTYGIITEYNFINNPIYRYNLQINIYCNEYERFL